ncbi:MAG: hypothetical protein AAFR98_01545 [Pseudomonadota bacterium]
MKLFKDESGAVTVDWVVLCAALVLLAAGVVGVVNTGLQNAASQIEGQVAAAVSSQSQ